MGPFLHERCSDVWVSHWGSHSASSRLHLLSGSWILAEDLLHKVAGRYHLQPAEPIHSSQHNCLKSSMLVLFWLCFSVLLHTKLLFPLLSCALGQLFHSFPVASGNLETPVVTGYCTWWPFNPLSFSPKLKPCTAIAYVRLHGCWWSSASLVALSGALWSSEGRFV